MSLFIGALAFEQLVEDLARRQSSVLSVGVLFVI